MANIGPGEAIRVKYVLNARKISNGFLVWKRRRRRQRPPSGALRSLRSTMLHFSIPLFSFFISFFQGCVVGLVLLSVWDILSQTPPTSAPPLSLTPLLLLCPRQTPCAQHPPLLRGSTRPAPRTLTEAHTSSGLQPPQNVGRQGLRQGLRQASGSICWQAARRGECCDTSGHDSARKRGACVWPHAQKVNAPQRNVCCQAGWGKGGNRERQAACCAEEEDAHHEASYDDATIAARR